MQDRRRVVITGIGAITAIGVERQGLWEGILAQRSAVRGVTRFDPTPFRSHNAAEVPISTPATSWSANARAASTASDTSR